ncbi:MAG: hypothetical protein H8E39_05950 [Alphaproteobacteria bacterium]|nr:hypothetical protein [Alphaproteobacteria bacterium]
MEIEEQVADLLYILADIQLSTEDSRIEVMAEAMQITVMEIDALNN